MTKKRGHLVIAYVGVVLIGVDLFLTPELQPLVALGAALIWLGLGGE